MTTPRETVVVLNVGDPAPPFVLPSYPAGQISLVEYLGKKNVILAFYPKDDTPGCTREMCSFSADLGQFDSAGTQVLGISLDDMDSHEQFAAKHKLLLPLLSDREGLVARAYGTVKGDRPSAERVLFIIDKKGIIRHIHQGMPTNAELLDMVARLS